MANPITHFEIMGKDSAALQKFYRDVFNWKLTPPMKEMGNYSLLQDHEPGIGGGIGEGDARVSVYVEVDDPQAYLDRAVAAGARVLMPVETITPTTTIAMFSDPAGNITGIVKAQPQPRTKTTARKSAARKATGTRKQATARKTTARKRTGTRRARRPR